MTRSIGHDLNEPFHVQARTARCSVSSGETPGGSGRGKPAGAAPSWIEELDSAGGQIAVGTVLAVVYLVSHLRPMFSAITVPILLAAVMYRLDPRRRRIAAAPISLSSAMLFHQIINSGLDHTSYGQSAFATVPDGTAAWLPLFLAACLFYAPKFPTATEKILMVVSLLVLGSGMLPGNGFAAILATTRYFLFIGVGAGLAIDFSENGSRMWSSTASPQK